MSRRILTLLSLFFVIGLKAQNTTCYDDQKDTFTYEKIGIIDQNKKIYNKDASVQEGVFLSPPMRTSNSKGHMLGELSVSSTGAATYNVPIVVPPGINGVKPEIALTYNSQSGNGVVGYGWNIGGLSSISRIPATKYHDGVIDGVDFDYLDRFSLDGQRLILKSGTYGEHGAEYETEMFSNLKIVSIGTSSNGPSYFIVYYPDGSKAYYGNSADSKSLLNYAITYWQNPQGVRISYEYEQSHNSLRIKKIKYGGLYSNPATNELVFTYGNKNRADQVYVNNISVKRTKELRFIEVFSNGVPYRKYQIDATGDDDHDLNYDKLNSIIEYSGDNLEIRTPLKLYYNPIGSGLDSNGITTTLGLENIEQRNAEAVSLDLTGNGKMDFLVYPKEDKDKFWLFKDIQDNPNNDPYTVNTGEFETVFPTVWLNHLNQKLSGQGLTIVQNSNDNQVEFKVYSNGIASPLYLQYTKIWDAPTATYDDSCLSTNENAIDKQYVSGDFNGDGLTDVLAIHKPYTERDCNIVNCDDANGGGDDGNGNMHSHITEDNHKKETKSSDQKGVIIGGTDTCCDCNTTTYASSKVYFIDLDRNISTDFSNLSGNLSQLLEDDDVLKSIDFNGDGKTDLLHIKEGKLAVYTLNDSNNLNLVWQSNDPGIKLEDPLLFGDYNGDGKTDFLDPIADDSKDFRVFLSTGRVYINATETMSFKYLKPRWNGANGSLLVKNLVPVDANGDGKTDIVEYETLTYNGSSEGTQTIRVFNNLGIGADDSPTDLLFKLDDIDERTGGLKHYPIPIFLTSDQTNKGLDFASISNQWVTSFSFNTDHRIGTQLAVVKNNGITYKLRYNGLDSSIYIDERLDANPWDIYHPYTNMSVYESSGYEVTYPNVDIQIEPGVRVVNKIIRYDEQDNPTSQRIFTYKDAIYNTEGQGFLGFRRVAKSNWHTEHADRIFDVYEYDPLLKRTLLEHFSRPYDYFSSSGFITKTTYQNSHSILANKVFKLQVDSNSYQNALNGTYTNSFYSYDLYNNPTTITTNNLGGSTTKQVVYDNNTSTTNYYIGRPTSINITSSIGSEFFSTEEQFIYSGYLLLQKKSKGNGTPFDIETFEYDTYGNITKRTITPNGEIPRELEFEYDQTGKFLTKFIDIEGLETSYEYNSNTGTLHKEIDPYGRETLYDYDSWNRSIKVTDYLGNEVQTTYSEENYTHYNSEPTIVSIVSDSGSEIIKEYDALGRLLKTKEKDVFGDWVSLSYEYDALDRLIRQSEPYSGDTPNQWNEIDYDFYNRPITNTLYTGRVFSISYNGLSTTVDDGVKTVTTTKDDLGNILSVTDPGGTINYAYYGNGGLKSSNYNGVVVSVQQDGWGRKIKLADPSAGVYEYKYNGFGEVTKEITPKGETNYIYSSKGKLLNRHITGDHTDMSIQYYYNPTDKLLSSISVTSSDENNSVYGYAYDNHKRLSTVTESNPYAQFSQTYTYDGFGRVKTEEYFGKLLSNGRESTKKVHNVYQNGALKTIKDFNTNTNIWDITAINERGQLTVAQLGNNVSLNRSYDNYGYLTTNTVSKDNNGQSETLMQLSTDFDQQKGTLNSRSNSVFSWSETFEYDNLDRLISFNDNHGAQSHTYDDFGRITTNSSVGDYNYTGNSFKVANIELNNQGDLYYQQHQFQRVTYNAFKKPVDIIEQNSERVSFQYNAFLGRSHMFYGDLEENMYQRNNRKHYSFDGSMEISFDEDLNTTTFVTYIGGDGYSAPAIWKSKHDGQVEEDYYYLHRDYLGSIMLITDGNGNVKEKRHFDAWGNIVKLTDGNDNPLENLSFLDRGYTGHEHLHGVKLIHMNGRLYDPKLKRFLSPDNHIQDISNTQNYNRYSYVYNNPLMYTDPSGETVEDPPGEGYGQGTTQVAAGSLLSSLFQQFEDAQIGRWIGNQFEGLGDWIGGWFKKKSPNPISIVNNQNTVLSDPMSHSGAALGSANFGPSGNSGGLGVNFGNWINRQAQGVFLFSKGAQAGFSAGIDSTWNFVKSLGTSQGWRDLGNGLLDTVHMSNQYSVRGMYLRSQASNAIGNYIDDLPDKSPYQLGYDVGFVSEKVVETIALSKGAGLVGSYIRGGSVATRGGSVATRGINPSSGPLKNISGNLDDAAKLARSQPYGPVTNVYRRLPRSAQDIVALEGAYAGEGRLIIKSLSDPRYRGWEKWHYSVGPKGGKSVVHYIRDPKTGYLTDFKFK